uniref:Uncharacterized protein n=1 Tax=Panagrolaimus sp. ES5 TaxID=591445 RepID=A0AC34G149_9BILA
MIRSSLSKYLTHFDPEIRTSTEGNRQRYEMAIAAFNYTEEEDERQRLQLDLFSHIDRILFLPCDSESDNSSLEDE